MEGLRTMHYKAYKTILSPQNGMNIFRGCTHGCIYCDSRSKCYQMDHDFEDIEIKKDAPQMLELELSKKRKKAMVGTGAMTDPYIPLERNLEYTRRCLEVIYKHGFGIAIQTKSADILRDIDLLEAINKRSKAVVQMTLTTYDDALCQKIEPHVSPTSERIKVLFEMKKRGIPTVVWLSPFLPFINDTPENIRPLLEVCVEAQVKGILCFGIGLTLREGNREYFYSQLERLFPGMKEKYIEKFGYQYECRSDYNYELMKEIIGVCRAKGILYKPQEVFQYLHSFEEKSEGIQLSLFS